MPAAAAKFIQSAVRNGVGSFVQPCSKITLRYCNAGGSSRGMREFLRTQLRDVAAANARVEFEVLKKAGHPLVQGHYPEGRTKVVCVRNMTPQQIKEKIGVVRDASGARLQKYNRAVESRNESVRGIWSPFHVDKEFRLRI